MKPLIIAHRGASSQAPENTLAAFQQAIDLGCDGAELDVRKTEDDVLVVVHDPAVQNRLIKGLTYAELAELNRQIPTLEQVLKLCAGKLKLNVELKEVGYPDLAGKTLIENFSLNDLVVTSFSARALIELHKLYPQIPVGLILGTYFREFNNFIKLIFSPRFGSNFQFLSLNYKHVLRGTYKLFRFSGKTVWCWTVDDPRVFAKLAKIPAVAAVISNQPSLIIKMLNYGNPR